MKKVLIIGIILLAFISIYNILSLYTGIYIKLDNNKDIDYLIYTKKGDLFFKDAENKFRIKGVELSSSYPGYNFSDYKIDKTTYLRWINQIYEMGANTIKVTNRLNPDFYKAFYEFNQGRENPIYLIQCIDIEEYRVNNSESLYGYKDDLIKNALISVDVVHGNRYVFSSGIAGSGLYNNDISKWTLGYIITNIGKDETIAYTDNTDIRVREKGYNGKYFYTIPGKASETECIIAEIMDKIVAYESAKYNEQRLVSVMLDLLKDPFRYKQNMNIQLGKISYINLNNVIATDKLKSGKIVSYSMDDSVDEFDNMLVDDEKENFKDILNTIDEDSVYAGYVDFINKYYDSPVLIVSYVFSTARITDTYEIKALNEQQQGETLIKYYNEFIKCGSCGGIICSWQDNWEETNWNIKYSTEEKEEIYWHNKQSINQNKGLLKFEKANKEQICYVDGDISEWDEESIVNAQDGMNIYSRYDYENLYIMIKNIEKKQVVIPIDITPNSGSNSYENISFSRPIDFLIRIDGKENSEIIVQQYYDSVRAMYEDNITGDRQFSDVPGKYTNKFVPIRAIQKNQIDLDVDISLMTAEQRIKYRMYKVAYIGNLVHGNGNPNADDYNSLSDFCFGEKCVEIQIPWQLINFSSPSELLIHDDYYTKYGVENIKIDGIYLGVGYNTSKNINLEKFNLEQWTKNIIVEEKLKKSYEIIKESWNNKNDY